jgi:hypothetical protein
LLQVSVKVKSLIDVLNITNFIDHILIKVWSYYNLTSDLNKIRFKPKVHFLSLKQNRKSRFQERSYAITTFELQLWVVLREFSESSIENHCEGTIKPRIYHSPSSMFINMISLRELKITFEDHEILVVRVWLWLGNIIKGEITHGNSIVDWIWDHNQWFEGIVQRSRIGVLYLWRIEDQSRIRGDWRTCIGGLDLGVQDRMSLRLAIWLLYSKTHCTHSLNNFFDEIYFSIFRLKIGRETYMTVSEDERKSRNSLITSCVSLLFFIAFFIILIVLNSIWNSSW